MQRAIDAAQAVRGTTAPNPWVGALLTTAAGRRFSGATEPPPGRHAERVVLDAAAQAGADTSNAVLHVTLEPCCHTGRTSPCTDAIISAGVGRVVVGVVDPDAAVAGGGIAALQQAGIAVSTLAAGGAAAGSPTSAAAGAAAAVINQLEPYLHHRRTGQPWVVLKLAATADGRTAAADASSQWITGEAARIDAHRLRARCDTVLVGAGTVRADNPALTVRLCEGADPRRVVLGQAPANAAIHPCWEMAGEPAEVLTELGEKGVVDLLVEGGANVAAAFHSRGLVNEYVLYMAPALMGGNDGLPIFDGTGAPSIDDLWRGEFVDVIRLGDDIRITLKPVSAQAGPTSAGPASAGLAPPSPTSPAKRD